MPGGSRCCGLTFLVSFFNPLRRRKKSKYTYKLTKFCPFISYCSVHSLGPLRWHGVSARVCMFMCACVHLSTQYTAFSFHLLMILHNDTVWVTVSTIAKLLKLHFNAENCVCLCMCASAPVFVLQFTTAGTFETVWQVKFYNYNKRDHCQWGNSFNSIEYECKPNDTRTLMWVNKETFVWQRNSLKNSVYTAKTLHF